MKTYLISLQKSAIGLMVVAGAFMLFASPASAANYYSYHGYQSQAAPLMYFYQYGQFDRDYEDRIENARNLLAELQRLQQQLLQLQTRYQNLYGRSFSYNNHYFGSRGSYDVEVDTLRARNVEDDEATLYGDIDLDGAAFAEVWFEYGEDSDLDEETRTIRVTRDGQFSIDVDDLDEDERYYFRAVAKAPNGDHAYGRIMSFDADSYDDDDRDSDDEEPRAYTDDAEDVSDDSADLTGSIDMNDFDDGDVFFVWGEDEDMIEDVEDEDRYADIDQDGDDLRKYKIYTGLDGDRDFTLSVFNLDDNTDYYFRICVEYEDEDNDDALECGSVEHFETD